MRKLWAKQNGSVAGCENSPCEIFWAFPLAPASPLLQNFDINCKNKHRKKIKKNCKKMKNKLETKIKLKLEKN